MNHAASRLQLFTGEENVMDTNSWAEAWLMGVVRVG
jgi:hypothetical protein